MPDKDLKAAVFSTHKEIHLMIAYFILFFLQNF